MRNFYVLYSERAREFLHTCEKRRPSAYIVVSGESRFLEHGDFSLWRRSGTRVSEIIGCLSIQGRYESVVGSPCVISKMFPCMDFREGQVRPYWTRRLLIFLSTFRLPVGHFTRQGLAWPYHSSPSVYSWGNDEPIGAVSFPCMMCLGP